MKTDNILTFDNIPEWSIYALEYGVNEDSSLSEEDIKQIEAFISANFPHGYSLSVRWEERTEFDRYPAFGLKSTLGECKETARNFIYSYFQIFGGCIIID